MRYSLLLILVFFGCSISFETPAYGDKLGQFSIPTSLPSFTVTTLESPQEAGEFNSIAIQNDKVHISYSTKYSGRIGHLKYAANGSGSWAFTDLSPYRPGPIAIDHNNCVYIAYSNQYNIYCVTNESGSWVSSTVVSSGPGDLFSPSIAVDHNKYVHILYMQGFDPNFVIKYATNRSGSWQVFTIGSGEVSSPRSIAARGNTVYLCYFDRSQNALKCVSGEPGSWDYSTVTTDNLFDPSIAVDNEGKIHIIYFSLTTDLTYATNRSGSWEKTTIDTDLSSSSSSIAVDRNNKAHVAYFGSGVTVNYATNRYGPWVSTPVGSPQSLNGSVSIATDSGDKAHLTYWYSNTSDLMYAHQ
jgi:hypothetical protein